MFPRQSFLQIESSRVTKAFHRFPGLRVDCVEITLDRRENSLVRAAAPVRETPIRTSARRAGVEHPHLLACRRIEREHLVRRRVAVEYAIDFDRVRFECPRAIARIEAPRYLKLGDIALVDLFQARIMRAARTPVVDPPLRGLFGALRYKRSNQNHKHREARCNATSDPGIFHLK